MVTVSIPAAAAFPIAFKGGTYRIPGGTVPGTNDTYEEERGTYTYLRTSGVKAQAAMVATSPADRAGQTTSVDLTFETPRTGSFALTREGQSASGTFVLD
jgi:hypothetical protein